jgi:membrane-bound serine protease (ClpP class)
LLLVRYILKLRKRGAVSGQESIVGGIGTAMEAFSGGGKIWLEGESWSARSGLTIEKDQEVRVTAMDGLTLVVEPVQARAGSAEPRN